MSDSFALPMLYQRDLGGWARNLLPVGVFLGGWARNLLPVGVVLGGWAPWRETKLAGAPE